MNHTPARAAIWARVSNDDQDLENQLMVLRAWAGNRGLDVVRIYETEASAWTGGHRAVLNEALEDARHGQYEVLLVWALDRLSREGIEPMLKVMRQFRERGVLVLSHEESWTDGPAEFQELLTAFFAWVAQQESQRRSQRVKAGLAKKAARGEPIGRRPGAQDRKPRKKSGYYARWEKERSRT